MRQIMALALAASLIGFPVSAQDPGTIEVGFFGAQQDVTSPGSRGGGALVTVFVSRRVAIETHQDMLSLDPGKGAGSAWAVLAQSFGIWRIHAGPGMRFSPARNEASRLEPAMLVGARVRLYDWLGVRADARVTRTWGRADGAVSNRYTTAVFGGFSLRVRG